MRMELLKDAHRALDIMFARLIDKDSKFYPSKSGFTWDVMQRLNKAISSPKPLHVHERVGFTDYKCECDFPPKPKDSKEWVASKAREEFLQDMKAKDSEVWCEHISKDKYGDYRFRRGESLYIIPDFWGQCPVSGCFTPRPKPEPVKTLELWEKFVEDEKTYQRECQMRGAVLTTESRMKGLAQLAKEHLKQEKP